VGDNIVLTFSEPIQRGTGQIVLRTGTNMVAATYSVVASTNLNISGNTLTVNPTLDLVPNTRYELVIPAGAVKDLAGNSYAGTAPNPYNWTTAFAYFGNHYYESVTAAVSWSTALAQANAGSYRGLKGYLAVIDSAEENNLLKSFASQMPGQVYWHGISDAKTEGVWLISSGPDAGQRASFYDWAPGEPSNAGGGGVEHYALLGWGANLQWNDGNDSSIAPPGLKFGYVVEYGGLKPTYAISANSTTVQEGSSVTFTIDTTGVEWGTTISYMLSGVSQADLSSGLMSGTAPVEQRDKDGRATVTVQVAADQLTEGSETLTLAVGGASASVTVIDSSRAADTTPPTVTTFTPADEAAGVAVGANIVLTFSEAIQRGAGQIVLKTVAGATVATYDAATSANLSVTGNTLTLNPSADLSAGTAYKVEFAAGSVKDLAGNSYAGTAAYNFSTQAASSSAALQGMAYHWKSHALLSGVSVSVSSAGAVQADAGQLFDLRAAAFDAGSGALSVEVWVNPAAAFSNFDFAVATPGATAASFASALPAQWSVAAGTGNPQNVLVSGFSTAGAESGSVKLGTLQLTLPANGSGVQVAFNQIRVGDTTGADQGLAMKTSVTGSDGRYSFTSLGAQDLMLSASRSTADSGSAISSADALAALRIAVGLNPNPDPDGTGSKTAPAISPYQIMAADVNGSGSVTSADALAILRMAVKLSTALPQEWFFVEETRDFWNEATQSFTLSRANASWDKAIPVPAQGGTVNLVGVLKGDVNGSWAAPAGSTDLDVTDPTYFQRLAQLLGQPSQDQWGGPPPGP
jgi:methionine-rich copper-binding protein CopC